MSDTAATDAAVPTAEPQAPPAEPAAPSQDAPEGVDAPQETAPESGGDEAPKPLGRADARKRAVQSAREAFERQRAAREATDTASEDGEGAAGAPDLKTSVGKDGKKRHHRPDGGFASKEEIEGTAPAEGAEPAGEASPEASSEGEPAPGGEQEPERASQVPEGFVRIELDEDHPWRRGDAFSELTVPQEHEQLLRAAVNQPVLRRQVEGMQEQLEQLRRQNAELGVRLELAREGSLPARDPRMAALLEQIKDHPEYGELHDTLKEAVEKAPEALVAERMRDLDADTEVQATARSFLENVQRHVPQRYALWPEAERQRMVAQHIAAYGDLVDARGGKPDVREFFQRLDIAYAQDPRVQERIKDWREKQAKKREDEIREQVRKELEAERKAADEAAGRDAQQRHRSVRGVSVASRSARDGRRAVEPATEREKLQGLSPSERKRALRQRVVDRGRALQS